MPEIWATANDVLNERRTRLHTAEAAVPLTLWAVVLIGSALTMGTTVVLAPTRFHLWIIGLLATSIGLVFYLIAAMDRPFAVSRASAQRRVISRSRTWIDGTPSLRTHRDRTSRISTATGTRCDGLSRASQAEIAGFDFRHRSM